MKEILIQNKSGFNKGYTPITFRDESSNNTGMDFGILRLEKGEIRQIDTGLETALLLMEGKTGFRFDDSFETAQRLDLFQEGPHALHVSSETKIILEAETDCEFALIQTENDKYFEPAFFTPENMLENEHRGKGMLDDTSYRIVRTIFDKRNREDANLVLGEVVNFPGKWSSYPPHHHPQPEIYHYRFSKTQGYGHGEHGDDVLKIRHFDTLKIMGGKDHSQVAAPGYGMYYIWVIRHLDDNPYIVPEFTKEHKWIVI